MKHPNKVQIAELANQYGRQVFHSAFRVLSDTQLAEDVTQDVFLKLFKRSAKQFEQIAHWPAYLKSMAVSTAIDQLRHSKRLAEESLDELPNDRRETSPGPYSKLLTQQDLDKFRAALLRLNAKESEVFCLRHIEGYAYKEIAESLDLSKSLVGVTLHRAQQKLMSYLGVAQISGEINESKN